MLNLNNTEVSDLSPIAGMTGMTSLHLNNTQVSDLSPIAGMTGMTALYLDSTQVSNLSPISGMTGMKMLDLDNTQVSDISPIAGMTGMTTLFLSNTQVSDLSPIAGMKGMTMLYFNNTQVNDLSPIAGITGMTTLNLNSTQVSDISPIAGMKGMTELYLGNTQVSDLRPVLSMRKLVDEPDLQYLTFRECAACDMDPELARISEIEDKKDRARELFAYLEDWVPPGEEGGELAPDKAVPVTLNNGKISVDSISPDAMDALQETLHKRLRDSAGALSKAAGNQFPRLCAVARSVLAEAEKTFEDVDLLNLYLDNEALKDWQSVGAEDGMAFPDEVTVPLADVTRTVPGLTLGDEAIEKLVERINRDKGVAIDPDVEKRQRDMSDTLNEDEDAVDGSLRDLNKRLDQVSDDVSLLVRKTTNKNVLLRVAGWVGSGAVAIGLSITAGAIGEPVIAMVTANWAIFIAAAESISPQLAHYFASAFAEVPAIAKQANQSLKDIQDRLKK